MLPPWIAFPQLTQNSLGWSLGPGEYHRIAFRAWFVEMSPEAREAYERDNAEPQGWNGFYARIKQASSRRQATRLAA